MHVYEFASKYKIEISRGRIEFIIAAGKILQIGIHKTNIGHEKVEILY